MIARNRAHLRSDLIRRLPSGDILRAAEAFGNRFDFRETLHRSRNTEVARYFDQDFGRQVVVRFTFAEADQEITPAVLRSFRATTRILAAAAHPAIVSVYESGLTFRESTEALFVILEDMDAGSLRERLPITESEAADTISIVQRWFGPLMAALDRLHRLEIVHRNLRPETLLIDTFDRVKLGGFRFASYLSDLEARANSSPPQGLPAAYTAPEVTAGQAVTVRSDIYSIGCILYEVLARRPVFVGESDVEQAYMHLREKPDPPSALTSSSAIQPLDKIALRALAKDPSDRYESVSDMQLELDQAVASAVAALVGAGYPQAEVGEDVAEPDGEAEQANKVVVEQPIQRMAEPARSAGGSLSSERQDARKSSGSGGLFLLVALLVLMIVIAALVGVR
ncbi:serine/threonine protein kinase [Pseudonocardia endophytica]|uniref:non-specific serine/threonine protein kinase n=1 Tax=Pseudonocardia endophytica TaxID=401976 RepID=A0A4R1HRL3_PSEEN|nr:serine/threonine-protein kinase [Pseudonocardia endophytica]TCK25227.1 protein kinase-like protein [Pseudonocardia endophytica]